MPSLDVAAENDQLRPAGLRGTTVVQGVAFKPRPVDGLLRPDGIPEPDAWLRSIDGMKPTIEGGGCVEDRPLLTTTSCCSTVARWRLKDKTPPLLNWLPRKWSTRTCSHG